MPCPQNIRYFASLGDFRKWLEEKYEWAPELWVGFHKKSSGKPSITYSEAVDEALCFGWIDGVRKSIDAYAYTIRFTPRKARSQWSAVNIQRVQRLSLCGRMLPAGLKAFEGATEQKRKYSFEQRQASHFTTAQGKRFRSNRKAWHYFQAQPPWYRRTATFWVVSAKKEVTRERRLATLIADSAAERSIKPLQRPSRNGRNQ
jgi:uncharacterized protein YdeI (YjbR/CyaY-like superfamily)